MGQPPRQSGTSVVISVIIILLIGIFLYNLIMEPSIGGVPPSTIKREALAKSAADQNVSMLRDDLGWIKNPQRVAKALQNFHEETGVYITLFTNNNIYGEKYSVSYLSNNVNTIVSPYLRNMFTSGINNPAHMIVMVYDDGETWDVYFEIGHQAGLVFDDEAEYILMGYFEQYARNSNLDDDAWFIKTFESTAKRLMSVTRPWYFIPVVLILAGGVIAILFLWWKKRREQENIKHAQTMEILNTDIDKLGDNEAERLAKAYDDGSNTNDAPEVPK